MKNMPRIPRSLLRESLLYIAKIKGLLVPVKIGC